MQCLTPQASRLFAVRERGRLDYPYVRAWCALLDLGDAEAERRVARARRERQPETVVFHATLPRCYAGAPRWVHYEELTPATQNSSNSKGAVDRAVGKLLQAFYARD